MLLYLAVMIAVVRGLNARSSTIGHDFVFGILDMGEACWLCQYKDNTVTVDVTNVSPQAANVRLFIPRLNVDTSYIIPPGQHQNINISNTIEASGLFRARTGIQITSDNDVSVLVTNSFMSIDSDIAMDVYNVLPVTSVGNIYKVLSHQAGYIKSEIGSAYLVTALYNDTKLTVSTSSDKVYLDALEVYQYVRFHPFDFSGIRLEADHNISVIAGTTFCLIPNKGYDYMASEMMPYSAWTTSYIVPPLLPNSGFLLKAMSDHNSAITVANLTHSLSLHANLHEMEFQNLSVIVTSSEPIALAQYGVFDNQTTTATGDLFMTVVPGIQQYINNYVFTVPHAFYGNTQHYIAIIAPKQEKNNIMLDTQSVQSRNISRGDITELNVPHPFDNYTVLTFQTTEGFHHFWHPKTNVVFGVLVYGLGDSLGYGFFAGYDLEGKESSFALSSSTAAPSSQGVTSSTVQGVTSSTVQGVTSSTVTMTMSNRTQGQLCYQCDDLIHPYLCDTLHKCSSNEICYLESYLVSGQTKYRSGCTDAAICYLESYTVSGQTKYRSGCKDAAACEHGKTAISGTTCYECCQESFCNNNGCGDLGIPDRSARGPICFHCDYASNPDECLKVQPCEPHEACIIEKYTWFGDNFHYKMGCGYVPCNTGHVVKRAALVCNHCCNDDFCNRNCTMGSDINSGPALIG